jgi:hypothetical protein
LLLVLCLLLFLLSTVFFVAWKGRGLLARNGSQPTTESAEAGNRDAGSSRDEPVPAPATAPEVNNSAPASPPEPASTPNSEAAKSQAESTGTDPGIPEEKDKKPGETAKQESAPAPNVNSSGESKTPSEEVQNNNEGGANGLPGGSDNSLQDSAGEMPASETTRNFVINREGASFFGIEVEARKIAFVVDISGSMLAPTDTPGETRLECLKKELLRSIKSLSPRQKFWVVFFNTFEHVDDRFMGKQNTEKGILLQLAERIDTPFHSDSPVTDPTPALERVLPMRFDAVFLLSDGEFDPSHTNTARIKKLNRSKTKICTIALGLDSETLREIASESGGEYKSIK